MYPVTANTRATLLGTSDIVGMGLVPGDSCAYAGTTDDILSKPGSLFDFAHSKLAYSVDFSCGAPRVIDYYIVVAGYDNSNFTLDVTNVAESCNCDNGVCRNSGTCSCYAVSI